MIFFEKVELFDERTRKFKKYIYINTVSVSQGSFSRVIVLNMCLTSNGQIRIRNKFM